MATKQARISNWRDELTPNIVDHLAKVTPDAPYALYPNSPLSYDQGYRTVTYRDFANAINGLAWWLEEKLGACTTFDVLAYIGPNDVRYTALLLAAIKAGYVAFFTSPRNSIAAHDALFQGLKCRTMLTPSPAPPAVESMLSACAHPMTHLHVPSVAELLDERHAHYPYDKTYAMARSEPFVVIHTSGSTGIPKPLIWTHESAARHSKYIAQDPPPGFEALDRLSQGKRILNTFPPFHGACIATHLFNSVPFGTVSIALLSGAIPTAEGLVSALKAAPAEVAFLVPSIAADLAQAPPLLEYCSQHLQLILYAGGDLPQAVGDKIATKVPIHCQYGASEIGLTAQLLAPEMTAADWRWIRYHPNLGLEFEQVAPGMFEMTVKRDPKFEEYQIPFTIGPSLQHLQVYRSRDLFEKHPTIPDCWGWRARADDIIVFLNGEKTNPVSMEQHIVANNKDITAALVVGMQRFQAALLVEPAQSLGKLGPEEAAALIDTIWPSVDEANKVSPAHARVEKSLILLTAPEKPMIRSGKGTIQRQGTVAQYTAEIDELYLKVDTGFSSAERASVDTKDANQVSQFIRRSISHVDPDLVQEEDGNFFALGMDSLMAIRLVRALRHGLGNPDLSVSVVHNNPSVQQLTDYIVGARSGNGAPDSVDQSELGTLLAEYEQDFRHILAQRPTKTGEIVVLTGSTGSLGTYLLEALLMRPDVSHIYALNRRKNAKDIYQAKSKASGFPFHQHEGRVSFLHAVLDQPRLGLDEATYEVLRMKTTLFIHNAWPVNFLLPFKAFRPHFDGLTNIFLMASSRPNPPRLLYISSMSSVAKLQRPTVARAIPEVMVRDFDAPYPMGYAKSKLFSELLCDTAARTLGIPASFARVGQIAGPVNGPTIGLWNTSEWLPSLIITSISLGSIPETLGAELDKVDWIPVDILAKVLVELGTAHDNEPSDGAEVFNVLGPRPTSWQEVLPSIVKSIEQHSQQSITIVPLSSWLQLLRTTADEFSDDTANVARTHPAIKLLEFYEDRMLHSTEAIDWNMERAISKSKSLRETPAVGAAWIDGWVKGWISSNA